MDGSAFRHQRAPAWMKHNSCYSSRQNRIAVQFFRLSKCDQNRQIIEHCICEKIQNIVCLRCVRIYQAKCHKHCQQRLDHTCAGQSWDYRLQRSCNKINHHSGNAFLFLFLIGSFCLFFRTYDFLDLFAHIFYMGADDHLINASGDHHF